MYSRVHEDECPDCLTLLQSLLSSAQRYIAHLSTLRPKNEFKKDDDLHGQPWTSAEAAGTQMHMRAAMGATLWSQQHTSVSSQLQPTIYETYGTVATFHSPAGGAAARDNGALAGTPMAVANEYVFRCASAWPLDVHWHDV